MVDTANPTENGDLKTTPAGLPDPQPTTLEDGTTPTPPVPAPLATMPDEPEGQGDKPQFFGENSRRDFYARRARGAREATPDDMDPAGEPVPNPDGPSLMDQAMAPFAGREGDEPPVPVTTPQEAPTAPAATRAPAAPPADKRYTLKVNHNEFDVSRDELLKLAGMSEEEAAGLPDPVLVRSAQLVEANRIALAENKTKAPPAHHAAPGEDPNDPPATSDDGAPSLEDLAAKIQFGDGEEAVSAISDVVRRELEAQRARESQQVSQRTIDEALATFQQQNADIVSNPRAMNLCVVEAVVAAKESLVRIVGVPAQNVAQLSNEDTMRAYSEAQSRGFKLPGIDTILSTAEKNTRETLNMPRQGTAPAPVVSSPQQTQAPPQSSRVEAKRNLVQVPQHRAGVPANQGQPAPTREDARTRALNQMRASRFQKPLEA